MTLRSTVLKLHGAPSVLKQVILSPKIWSQVLPKRMERLMKVSLVMPLSLNRMKSSSTWTPGPMIREWSRKCKYSSSTALRRLLLIKSSALTNTPIQIGKQSMWGLKQVKHSLDLQLSKMKRRRLWSLWALPLRTKPASTSSMMNGLRSEPLQRLNKKLWKMSVYRKWRTPRAELEMSHPRLAA